MTLPQGVDWFIWRPVFSTHAGHIAKHEIDEHWSLIDLIDCHELIDMHEDADQRMAAKMRMRSGKR